jgi:hypothetical protein
MYQPVCHPSVSGRAVRAGHDAQGLALVVTVQAGPGPVRLGEVAEVEQFEQRLAYWTARVLVAGPALAAGRRTFYSLVDKSYDDALTSAYDVFLEMFA